MEKINLCRVFFGFMPGGGGSVTHTIELSQYINPCLSHQCLILPKIEQDTSELDNSFPFKIQRIGYCRFIILGKIKRNFLPWLPVAPLIQFSFGISVIKKILSLNKANGIDIIQAHGSGVGMAATIAGWMIKKPVVWMMHGTSQAYSRISGFYETLLTKFFKPSHMFVLDDGSPAPDKFTRLLKQRVTIVFHAIDTDKFKPKPKPIHLLEELNIPKNSFILFSPHSLIPVKGQEYALKAFRDFVSSAHSKQFYLIMLGEGTLKKGFVTTVKEWGLSENIKFIDTIPNSKMVDYYSLSDVVLATSLYSNMNRAVQEAMACAKPVVAFNSGGTSKVVIDGQTGLLAKPEDVKILVNKIHLLYTNKTLREDIGKRAREFIIQNRSWKIRIDKELKVFNELLKQSIS